MASSPANRFRTKLTETLGQLPFITPRGMILPTRQLAHFGTPSGAHNPLDCWVYAPRTSELHLLFAFYKNFSPDDLICKVVSADDPEVDGEGATIQFNGKEGKRNGLFKDQGDVVELCHHGLITVGTPIKRQRLLELIGTHAPRANQLLNGINFPFRIGDTDELAAFLDRLFLYAYAIEQVKRSLRDVQPLPLLTRADSEPGPSAPAPTTPDASDVADVKPERAATTTYRILRDTALARRVKILHKYECQICGHTIMLADGSRYAEAHHVKPLGSPHDGLDIIGNILCLCPNHHAECDLGAIRLLLSALRAVKDHDVEPAFVEYHNREIYGAME